MPKLHIALPENSNVVDLLISRSQFRFDSDDARDKQLHEPDRVMDVYISDKGQNLRGLIEIFGSFWTAQEFCESRFWREALATLAGHDARRHKNLYENIGNVVLKELVDFGTKERQQTKANRITEKILPYVHGTLEDKPMSYNELKELLEKVKTAHPDKKRVTYISGDTVVDHFTATPLSEIEMIQGLNNLLALNVLRIGLTVRCQRCGTKSFFHIDEVRQFNECAGCGNPRPLTVDSEWRYRLNSLAKECVSGRIFAVLQALTSLNHYSTSFFFYSPSLNLYRPKSDKPWRELDLACVRDGELIIGEIKDGAFDKGDFDRFIDAAEVILPDRAAIFIPYDRFDKKSKSWFSELKIRLESAGIYLEIHQLPAF